MKKRTVAFILSMMVLAAVPAYAETDEQAEPANEPVVAEIVEPSEEQETAITEEPTEVASEIELLEEVQAVEEEKPTRVSWYERDSARALILDEQGNPVPILPEDATQKPVAWQRDDAGDLVLDQWGEPIATQYVDIDAEKIATIEDVLDPARSIDVYASWEGDALYYGAEARLKAVLHGYDHVVYTLQWETSVDGIEWVAVEDAREAQYKLIVTEENYLNYWRVRVTVTDVNQEAT